MRTRLYIGVKGTEIVNGLSCDNPAPAMIIADLCHGLLRLGIDVSRISVIAPYCAHIKTICSVLDETGIICKTIHKMQRGENDVIILATTRSNAFRDLGFVNQPAT